MTPSLSTVHSMSQNTRQSRANDYLRRFAAQTPALGRKAQLRLRDTHVVVVGAGGVGSAICLALTSVGVGRITAIDPQPLESDNFNRYVFARESDVGAPKVSVLARAVRNRLHVHYQGMAMSCEAGPAQERIAAADIIVSTSNTLASRMLIARLAVQHEIAYVFAGIEDARVGFGGIVGAWIPERRDLACQGCYLQGLAEASVRGAALVTTAITIVSGLAAHLVLQLVTSQQRERLITAGNLLELSLDTWRLKASLVRRHPRCNVCTGVR